MHYTGWCQVAFERDLTNDLTAASVGTSQLVLVRAPNGIRAFDAVCPHRGTHLAFGGRLDGEAILCPFHGYRIGLGQLSDKGFRVREYRTMTMGGMVFVLMSELHENGFTALMARLAREHVFVPGFAMLLHVSPELVIENGFDNTHFRSVHGICNEPEFVLRPSQSGELIVEGMFELPPAPWQNGKQRHNLVRAPYIARAFSPCLAVTELGGETPYGVITAATPTPDGACVVRLSLAVPTPSDSSEPSQDWCRMMLGYSRAGLEQDRIIWENLSITSPSRLTVQDSVVIQFREFCQRFQEPECRSELSISSEVQ
jgi:3-ketosteroid 9alpha-monooxygenase subunit A